jgi:hypothetical protein
MAGPFEHVARVAIAEIIQNHAKESKFGYLLTKESFKSLCDDLHTLLMTSRNLKSAGDRFIQSGGAPIKPKPGKRSKL